MAHRVITLTDGQISSVEVNSSAPRPPGNHLVAAMEPLDRKLFRDLWRLRGQVLAIALVIGSGVAVLTMSLSTLYFARGDRGEPITSGTASPTSSPTVKRAPEILVPRIAALPGVRSVETRVSEYATLDIEGFIEPVIGRIRVDPRKRTNRCSTVWRCARAEAYHPRPAGRGGGQRNLRPRARPRNRVTASRPFSTDTSGASEIVGTALSPEFSYAMAPGALMPDDKRFGVIWMGHEALAAAFDLEGAFNDLALGITRQADPQALVASPWTACWNATAVKAPTRAKTRSPTGSS